MELYWGDLHNHCGITYGFGGLENALRRARGHLDFCAVTGHAMWPDMYQRNEETAFVVDFHEKGFAKLRENWDHVRETVAKANIPELVTFQSYEMHSSRYGDHHILSPDDNLPLIERGSPALLLRDVGVKAMTVAHHIGYTPGYRGIGWDEYDSSVTPLVEVCSKHGCAMSETAAFPYYHDMGPRDSRNTVYEGLRRGNRFGFVGSTDHHAGYPGSYGDCKAAVWAEAKTRESIWSALEQRRCYAVTGDRILCEFSVNGRPMGATAEEGGVRHITYRVRGCYPIDKIVVYKNLLPIHILNGETLLGKPGRGKYKLRVEMGWGNNAETDFPWEGILSVKNGALTGAEPCFRGRSILSPTNKPEGDDLRINGMDNRILHMDENSVSWQCHTVRNVSTLHPQTDAVIAEIDGTPDTLVEIAVNGMKDIRTLAELCRYGYSRHVKPYHSQAFKVHAAVFETAYTAVLELTDSETGEYTGDFYHMEVSQQNGCRAYVTPVYFR